VFAWNTRNGTDGTDGTNGTRNNAAGTLFGTLGMGKGRASAVFGTGSEKRFGVPRKGGVGRLWGGGRRPARE